MVGIMERQGAEVGGVDVASRTADWDAAKAARVRIQDTHAAYPTSVNLGFEPGEPFGSGPERKGRSRSEHESRSRHNLTIHTQNKSTRERCCFGLCATST